VEKRIHRITAAMVLLIALLVYLKTVAPTVSFWDCGEFIACAYTLGVPHPPGTPLYILIGRLFTLLPLGGDPSFPMNLISVLTSAIAILFIYLITVRLIGLTGEGDGVEKENWAGHLPRVVGGATAAFMLAFSDTFWFNSVEAEVYGFSVMLMAASLWLGLIWMEKAADRSSIKILLFVAYLMGLAGGLHLLCLLTVPTLLIFIWFRDRKLLLSPRVWGVASLLFLLGYSTYAALYIRSGLNPVIDENNPENWTNFMLFLGRAQYGSQSLFLSVFQRKAAFLDFQLWTMYFKYFFAQFPVPGLSFISEAFRKATAPDVYPVQISIIPYLLGILGIREHWRRDPHRFWAMMVLFVLTGVGLTVYLNMDDPQPRERDYVFVGSFAVFSIWMGIAASSALARMSRRGVLVIAGLLFLLMPVGMASSHFASHDRTGNHIAFDYGRNMLETCAPGSILFTNGDNDTFPLWFLQEVMGVRKDVQVVNLSLLNTNWYIKQLKEMNPGAPVRYTNEFIDQVLTAYTRSAVMNSGRYWPEDREVEAAGLGWTIPASSYGLLRVQDVMVLKIIDWNNWERPVYFGTTVPDKNLLGLMDFLQPEGMVVRLVKEKVEGVHVERAWHNLFELYWYRGVSDPSVYRDENTTNLITNYQVAFMQLTETLLKNEDMDRAYLALKRCEEVAVPPDDWKGYVLMAGLMNTLGRQEETQRLLRHVQTAEGIAEDTRLGAVAEVQMQIGKYDSAIDLYSEMIDRGLNLELALFNRAVSREKSNLNRGALDDLERLAKLAPGDREVAQAIELVKRKLQHQMDSEGRN
jgi:hypothetical protein